MAGKTGRIVVSGAAPVGKPRVIGGTMPGSSAEVATIERRTAGAPVHGALPADVARLLDELHAGSAPAAERRGTPRTRYEVAAEFRLFSDLRVGLYTRDVSLRGVGFITRDPLHPGAGGTLDVPLPDAGRREVRCIVLRYRQLPDGWAEGALGFTRDQPDLGRPPSAAE